MASEKAIVEAVKKAVGKRGAWLVKFHGNRYVAAGVPDLLVCYRGHFVAFECKLPSRKPTRLQEAVMRQIVRAGGIVRVVECKEDALEALDEVDLRVDGEPHTESAPTLA